MMITREDLKAMVIEALRANGGKASVTEVCKYIWNHHNTELLNAGNLLYTWQYDVRWAAHRLRHIGVLKPVHGRKSMPWELS